MDFVPVLEMFAEDELEEGGRELVMLRFRFFSEDGDGEVEERAFEEEEVRELELRGGLVAEAEAGCEEEAGEAAHDGVGEEVALQRREGGAHGGVVREPENGIHGVLPSLACCPI